jgi:hypothetical protein
VTVVRARALVVGLALVVGSAGCGDGGSSAVDAERTSTTAPTSSTSSTEAVGHTGHDGPTGEDRSGCDLMADVPQPTTALDEEEMAALEAEVETTRAALAAVPTVADAEAAGWFVSQPVPAGACLPTHLIRWEAMDGRWDLAEPEMLLAAGNGPDAAILAASYYVIGDEPVEGFTGREDTFHPHPGLCLDPSTHRANEVEEAECAAADGTYYGGGWMVHVWPLPDAPNPEGTFAVSHPGFANAG